MIDAFLIFVLLLAGLVMAGVTFGFVELVKVNQAHWKWMNDQRNATPWKSEPKSKGDEQ